MATRIACDECGAVPADGKCRQCGGTGELILLECEFTHGEHIHYKGDEPSRCMPARFDFAFIRNGVPWFRAIAEGQALLGGDLQAITRCTHPWTHGAMAFLRNGASRSTSRSRP